LRRVRPDDAKTRGVSSAMGLLLLDGWKGGGGVAHMLWIGMSHAERGGLPLFQISGGGRGGLAGGSCF